MMYGNFESQRKRFERVDKKLRKEEKEIESRGERDRGK